MVNKGIWSEDKEKDWKTESRSLVLKAFAKAEAHKKPSYREMFTEVFHDVPPHLERQWQQCKQHVEKYAEHYPLKEYEPHGAR